MPSYRYETRITRARRETRQDLVTYVAVGLFLCLTVIGAPIGIAVIVIGIVRHSRSSSAINQAEWRARRVAESREHDARIRAIRRL
ncbi:hypothetical protein [Nocardioides sp. SYSU D00038]|uniref:hypothetical protein n=1 Tax=Nocardioides sp. SYSU D00038 TaxID=2812554 RepID=UPI0019689BA8|nr:hypothetical protein [Nocardioides sp. SYSU D00038]